MAVANHRSMNMELVQGATDGTLKKRTGGMRGGLVEPTNDFDHDQAVLRGTNFGYPVELPYGEAYARSVMRGVVRP